MSRSRESHRKHGRVNRRRLRVESLESRRVLANFLVTTADDVVNTNDSVVSLREAIENANDTPGIDSIHFAPSVFDSSLLGTPSRIELRLGQLDITDAVVMTGPGEHLLKIDARFGSRVINFESSDGDLTLRGLTLTAGRTNNVDVGGDQSGGAIRFASNGTLTLEATTVSESSTVGERARGGAVFADTGNVLLSNSTLIDNHTSGVGASGGAIHAGSGTVFIADSVISGNTTSQTNARGGAIFSSGTQVSIIRSDILDNGTIGVNADGGAIFAAGGITIDGSRVMGNTTTGEDSDGGAVFANGSLAVLRSDVSSNGTRGDDASGGGLAADTATVVLESSSVTNNQTHGGDAFGGGLFAARSNVSLTNSTISGNSAIGDGTDGGGVGLFFSSATVTAATITRNTAADRGGGLHFVDDQQRLLTVENSIIAENQDSGFSPDLTAPLNVSALTVRSSLISDNTGSSLAESQVSGPDGNLVGDPVGGGTIDPLLGPLMQAGRTRIHPLQAGSPAIDAANNSLVTIINTDQRGAPFVRRFGVVVDMGSVERQTIADAALIVTTSDDELNFADADVSLREAIVAANGIPGPNMIRFDASNFADASIVNLTRGELMISDSLTIEGPGSRLVTIDAGHRSRVMTVVEGNHNVQLAGLTLTGGLATRPESGGGGVQFLSSGELTVRESIVTMNHSGADRAGGGGIWSPRGSVSVDHSSITANSTAGQAAHGGGIHSRGGLQVLASTISDNATLGRGSSGGALFGDRAGSTAIALTRSTVSGNATFGLAAAGGGVATSAGGLSVTNSTISGNHASGDGGGLFAAESTLHAVVASTIVLNNSNGTGGGLSIATVSGGTAAVHNSIIATNSDSGIAPDLDPSRLAAGLDLRSSLIGDNTGTLLQEAQAADADGNLIGAPNPGGGVIDPLLAPLALRGGITPTHAPADGSPVIDSGSATLVSQLPTDQRGTPFRRIAGDNPDIGAQEVQTLDGSTLVVTTSVDELDFSNGDTSLREAMHLASGSNGADTITFDSVAFAAPTTIELVFGQIDIIDSVNLIGPGRDLLTIDAGGDSRIFNIDTGTPTVLIQGLTLAGGMTRADNPTAADARVTDHSGGAIRFDAAGAFTLRDVAAIGNATAGDRADGGAIVIRGGSLSIQRSVLSGNNTSGHDAGGGAIAVIDGSVTIIESELSDNVLNGTAAQGGAILARTTSDDRTSVNITDSTVADNRTLGVSSGAGGGIAIQKGDLTISRATVRGNRTNSSNGDGGGILFRDGTLAIHESRIESNSTTGDRSSGGGISVTNAVLQLTNSSVTGNQVSGDDSDGGALDMVTVQTSIFSTTISGNAALGTDSRGGAIDSEFELAMQIVHATITDNSATLAGGGIALGTTGQQDAVLHNSIVAGNSDSGIGPDLLTAPGGTGVDAMFSLIGDNTGNSLAEAQVPDARGNRIGSAAGSGIINPGLGPLQINGGTTLTHEPLAGSPVIDTGNDALAVDANSNPLTSDQRGAPFTRFLDTVDLGAFEKQPPRQPIIDWPTPENIFIGTPLTSAQLNASTNTTGEFVYTPDFGTVLPLGDDQQLTVQFTPDDVQHYSSITASVFINVVEEADLGDAPSSYLTLRIDDGPRHALGGPRLGENVDIEVDGNPTDNADGDGDDDDGVAMITTLIADPSRDTTAAFAVTASSRGNLDAWIDFDGNGTFDHPSEHIANGISISVSTGVNVIPVTVPAGASPGKTFARFRISTGGGLLPTGLAADGEVEDYAITLIDGLTSPTVEFQLPRGSVSLLRMGDDLVVDRRGTEIFRAPIADVARYRIIGNEFSSVLTINSSGGAAIPNGGLSYDGIDRINTVRFVGPETTIDISSTSNVALRNVGVIDIGETTAATLRIDGTSARELDPRGSGIIVVGNDDDSIEFVDAEAWRMSEPESIAGFNFSRVIVAGTFVQVDFGSPWQNLAQPNDVNNDGNITALDALRIVNELSRNRFSDRATFQLFDPSIVDPWPNIYFDQNGDGRVTALDALRIINDISRQAAGSGERETVPQSVIGQGFSRPPIDKNLVDLLMTSVPKLF